MRLGLPSLVFDRESMPDLASLGINLPNIPKITPVTPPPLPSPELVEQYDQIAPSTSLIEQAVQEALENLPVMMGGITSSNLGPLGTSGISIMEEGPITMASDSPSPMSLVVEPEVTPMDSDIDRMIEKAVAEAMVSGGDMPVQAADDPVIAAVEAAVGNGQPTTDTTILIEQPTTTLPTETIQVVQEAQPDFMTQLNELIAQMQAEQTAAAEQAAAAEQQRQEQVAAMTQNYMVGQPAVGYNPYVSGQYQSDPYGPAGVPAMGGITTIPVPAAYNPNPYPIGGTT